MDILDDMGVSQLSAKQKFFLKVNYSFKHKSIKIHEVLCSKHLTTEIIDGIDHVLA